MFTGCQNAFTKGKLHTANMNLDIYGKKKSHAEKKKH